MKILLLTRFFSPETGGGFYLMNLIAELLANNGHEVWVITNSVEGIKNPHHKNIKIIFVNHNTKNDMHYWKQIDKIRFLVYGFKIGFSLIRKEKIEIIHSNAIYPVFLGSLLSFLTSKPHVMTIHDLHAISGNEINTLKIDLLQKLKSSARYFLEKAMIKSKANVIHTVSEATRDDLIKFGATKPMFVVPLGIILREPMKSKKIAFQFVNLGRLLFYKNVQVAIKAIKIVKYSFPDIKMIIIGDGNYKNKLEELVKNLELQKNIIFKGQIENDEKNQIIASSQALIFPSIKEGFGIVILEAFMHKIPVLVSDVRPQSDIVEHQKTGLTISPNDENEWAKAIEFILKNPQDALKMGENARDVLEEKYSYEVMKDKIIRIYSELLIK